jgi:F-type H+-transporting ATPase subunit delta
MAAGASVNLAIRSYAQALYNAARAQGVVQRLIEESKMLASILNQKPTFRRFLESPNIPRDKKRDLVKRSFEDRINILLMNLLLMMVDRERAIILSEILEEFQEIAERAEGIFPATVVSARELGFQEKLRLKTSLEKYTGVHLRIRYQVRPALLGGIVFRFQDKLVDGSVRHGLDSIRRIFEERNGSAANGRAA